MESLMQFYAQKHGTGIILFRLNVPSRLKNLHIKAGQKWSTLLLCLALRSALIGFFYVSTINLIVKSFFVVV